MQWFLGIDPGMGGGFALVNEGLQARVWPMPQTLREIWDLVAVEIHDMSTVWPKTGRSLITRAFVEEVHAVPKAKAGDTWKFAESFASVRMALIGRELPFELVKPRVWQKGVGFVAKKGETYSRRKARLRAKAQELYPQLASKVTNATADALLIAEHGRRVFGAVPAGV
jgi:hypothetical protein